jgi:hypothetical protein
MTSIYLVPYHSETGRHLKNSTGQFAVVENAIAAGEWPYDNGDDPSFYVARRGGTLTWGVCRQNVRNAIKPGSIVVFVSFTPEGPNVNYRLSAVATVSKKLDHRSVYSCSLLTGQIGLYLNILIRPDKQCWQHNENDRGRTAQHSDWLWRIAVHGRNQDEFNARYKKIYESDRFCENDVELATNYCTFSAEANETFISPNPPKVAVAEKGQHESWNDQQLRRLTVGFAAAHHYNRRDYLRTANRSGKNVHPHIRFQISTEQARKWRRELIAALKARSG